MYFEVFAKPLPGERWCNSLCEHYTLHDNATASRAPFTGYISCEPPQPDWKLLAGQREINSCTFSVQALGHLVIAINKLVSACSGRRVFWSNGLLNSTNRSTSEALAVTGVKLIKRYV
ncbi:hypothetical protein GN244_ATG04593 [Phytophthora infestans]|uniref:Uncharacterized protein n=1 Tax=Phytophthora infestans TaxID=4787 RepID=A0A833WJE4_PHYIN|nr:hypothetical protein GN244_ATG04593 [Phytophthora infestans]KAF4130923.1 hypothetical protein GN958_ATG19928 [Phytophthora infestans]